MPLDPNLVGVNKLVKLNDSFILAETASRGEDMETKAKNFIQGTIKNRIMDIGALSENISITAPILIGGGSYVDGRTLLTNQVANILSPTPVLPILQSATIQIGESGGKVSLQLMSDGNPATEVFTVSPLTAESLTDGTHSDVLNPSVHMPTRVAEWYDFRVCLAGFVYFIKDAKITIQVEVQSMNFVAGKDGSTSDSTPVPTPNPYNFGTQFPWLTIGSIQVSGGGQAAVMLVDKDGDGKYTWNADPTLSETINVVMGDGASSILSLQQPGRTITADKPFAMEVYDSITGKWVSLFKQNSSDNDLFDLTKSILHKSDFQVSTGVMTTDFEFKCYVI